MLPPAPDYEAGPWALNHRYLSPDVEERLTEELTDLNAWLMPTEGEAHLRLLTASRFSAIIEAEYPGSVVVPQGSTATGTALPVSDLDLIIFGDAIEQSPVAALKSLVKIFQRSRMVCKGYVLEHAAIPIAKLHERPFGFNLDICVGHVNGALNIPRVNAMLFSVPAFRPLLMFMKLFVYSHKLDNPAIGGFGSHHLISIVLLAIQAHAPDATLGNALLHLLDVFGSRLNYFLAGISTVGMGRLFSKRDLDLLQGSCPQALICEDPQFHGQFVGQRTSTAVEFRTCCARAYQILRDYDYTRGSGITAVLSDIERIVHRRDDLAKWVKVLMKGGSKFAYRAERVPTSVSSIDSKGQYLTRKDRAYALVAATAKKRQTKTMKRIMKRRRDQEKRAKEKAAALNFNAMWKMAMEEDKKRKQDRLAEMQAAARERRKTPPPFKR
jgi:hypothetical protein